MSFLNLFFDFIDNIWIEVFMRKEVVFEIAGVSVHYGSLILGFICVYMIVSYFWKGARS